MRKILVLLVIFSAATCAKKESVEHTLHTLEAAGGTVYAGAEDGTRTKQSEGLPGSVTVTRFYTGADGAIFAATMHSGLFTLKNGIWRQLLDKNTFARRSMLDTVDEYRKVTGFACSAQDPQLMAVAVKHALYITRDGGTVWNKVTGRITIEDYITALAFDSSNRLWIGTSYNGVYLLNGDSYTNMSDGLYYEPYAGDVVFYETVGHLEEINGAMYASQLFNKGLYRLTGEKWRREEIADDSPVFYIQDIAAAGETIIAVSQKTLYGKKGNTWVKKSEQSHTIDKECTARIITADGEPLAVRYHRMSGTARHTTQQTAAGKRAVYTNIHMLEENIEGLIRVVKQSGLNAIVIDVKDDNGDMLADVDVQKAADVGALSRTVDFGPYIEKLHAEDIYVIARMVVFKDKRLFRAFNGRYAIWDSKHDRPWRARNREYWCDPHAEYVRSYNIELAYAAAGIGFDEIQFDYIRFPADGPLDRCEYRYKKYPDMFKSEVLDDFLQEARRRISIPISVDIYGFTAFYNFGNRIGQDIEVFGRHVDAVSAMIYPSHYGYRFYMKGPREKRPYRIVYDTGIRSRFLSNDEAIMRPYLQAFNMKSPTFGPGYITYQVDAADNSGCDGYIFWHAGGSYDVVRRALHTQE